MSNSTKPARGPKVRPKSDAPEMVPPILQHDAPKPPPGSIKDAASELADQLKGAAESAEKPKRKPGRPKGSKSGSGRGPGRPSKAEREAKRQAEQSVVREQRVGLLATALAATFGPMVERAELAPPFGFDQAKALAEAWDPVIEMYADQGGPWTVAISATVVIALPYALQLGQRFQAKRAAAGREVSRVES